MITAPEPACLWLARALPFPVDAGDNVYSAGLSTALAATGMAVHVVGHAPPPGTSLPQVAQLRWEAVDGGAVGRLRALVSPLPLMAAVQASDRYRARLVELLRRPWAAVILDHLGSGWSLAALSRVAGVPRPMLIHLSHNHESAVWSHLWRESKVGPVRRLVMAQNYLKVRRLERKVFEAVDAVTTITDVDAHLYAQTFPGLRALVLPPGYCGPVAAERAFDASRARRVVIVGSFRYVAKQDNLRRFVQLADPVFARHGIGMDVIGDVPEPLLSDLRGFARATVFHGFVEDTRPLLANARMGIVPELIGGGFKLKFLDYLFGRLPIATIAAAAAGLPSSMTGHMLMADDMEGLLAQVVSNIDDVARLHRMQAEAFVAGSSSFSWAVRGRQLRELIDSRGAQALRLGEGAPRPAGNSSFA